MDNSKTVNYLVNSEKKQKKTAKPNKSDSKASKVRKTTRKIEQGTPIPRFKHNDVLYVSAYDLRNFVGTKGFKNRLRSELQNAVRRANKPNSKKPGAHVITINRKEIDIAPKNYLHLSPNQKTKFISFTDLENLNLEVEFQFSDEIIELKLKN